MEDPTIRRERALMTPVTPADRFDVDQVLARRNPRLCTLLEVDAPKADDVAHLASVLRSAAGWIRLAADELDGGDTVTAAKYAELGRFGAERMPERITALGGVTR